MALADTVFIFDFRAVMCAKVNAFLLVWTIIGIYYLWIVKLPNPIRIDSRKKIFVKRAFSIERLKNLRLLAEVEVLIFVLTWLMLVVG